MTVFSTLKHSTICLFSLTIGWVYPVCAETLEIIKTYDQTNKNNEVEAVIQFKVIDDKNRLKVLDKKDISSVTSNGESVETFKLIKPEDSSPDPSRIIILLDMSGSMKLKDSSGQVRGLAALQAIRSFIDYLKSNNYPSQVAVVPFAADGNSCGGGYLPPPVDNVALSKFYSPNSETLNTEISNLENTFKPDNRNLPCGGTDIRNPVKNAVEYLKNNYLPLVDSENIEEESIERLGIILVSDGVDNILSASKSKKDRELSQLETLLESNIDITLHTLGYGEEGSIDIEVLQRLANASGGVNLFSANATEINKALKIFLESLLGKYEIRYKPTSIKQYELEKVGITVAGISESKEEEFRIQNIPSLPLRTRIWILTGTLVFCGIFGLVPFLGWRWWLEREA